MPKAQAIQINWQFTGSAGIMQVEHTADCFGGTWLKLPLSTEVWHLRHILRETAVTLSDLAKYLITRSIAQPLCDSRATCHHNLYSCWVIFIIPFTMLLGRMFCLLISHRICEARLCNYANDVVCKMLFTLWNCCERRCLILSIHYLLRQQVTNT